MAATASGRCECRREAAVERATAGREAAGATATRAGACATAVKVQRARARAFSLMYYRRAQVAGVVCGVHARDLWCVWKPGEEAWVKSFDLVSTGDIVRPGSKNLTHG